MIATHSGRLFYGPAPKIECPTWCTVTTETHEADFGDWGGCAVHQSEEVDGVFHSCATLADNTPDPTDPPLVFIDSHYSDGVTLDEAEKLATRVLLAVAEARGVHTVDTPGGAR